jgi:sulfite exporter TauE/SafE
MFAKWNIGLGRLKGLMMKQFNKGSLTSLLGIGLLNGLLPCGFVYFALVGAIASNSPLMGASYMALFGLGTAPALFAMNIFGAQLINRMRINVNSLVPYVLVVFGLLFILRGMSLGIPFLSPEILSSEPAHVGCH